MDCDNTPNGNKVPFDPGWNDPPSFSYNAQQKQPNRPRNFLNKRVAFPLSSADVPMKAPAVNLPPMPSVQQPSAVPTLSTNEVDSEFDSESVLEEVKMVLLEFLTSSSELGAKANSIQKRISVMEEMWRGGKLNTTVQLQMKDLAFALRDDQPSKADDIHRALMVDHVSSVGSWMPGVKQLVHHCIARSELLAIEEDS